MRGRHLTNHDQTARHYLVRTLRHRGRHERYDFDQSMARLQHVARLASAGAISHRQKQTLILEGLPPP